MGKLLDNKIELDNKIKSLIEEFAMKNKCGYEGSVSAQIIKETTHTGGSFFIGISAVVETVITT